MTSLAGVIWAVAALFGGSPAALGAAPAGEIKLASEQWGHEIPVPHLEMSQGIDWMKLLYDPLVGTNP